MIGFIVLLVFLGICKLSPALGLTFIGLMCAVFGKDVAHATPTVTLQGTIEFGVCTLITCVLFGWIG